MTLCVFDVFTFVWCKICPMTINVASLVALAVFWYLFVHLSGEEHSERKLFCES